MHSSKCNDRNYAFTNKLIASFLKRSFGIIFSRGSVLRMMKYHMKKAPNAEYIKTL